MITPELIQRINALAKKKKNSGLSHEELAEQAKLRRTYLDGIRAQLKDTLERIEIVDDAEESNCIPQKETNELEKDEETNASPQLH